MERRGLKGWVRRPALTPLPDQMQRLRQTEGSGFFLAQIPARRPAQGRISTSVPIFVWAKISATSGLVTAMQPAVQSPLTR